MKSKFFFGIIFLAFGAAVLAVLNNYHRGNNISSPLVFPSETNNKSQSQLSQPDISGSADNNPNNPSGLLAPLPPAGERVAKKPFGIFITPQNSPVQAERFQGYHTGADFEIFPEELNADVPVKAICDGKLLIKKSASGYGGVAVESCELDGQPITIVYGHLKLASITLSAGDALKAGDIIGLLGADKSAETSGERKHLHLGIHRGAGVNILGYIPAQADLANWIDPCLYVCK